ncbi:MAG: Rrf2 family transcriptional regulator [Marinilabiliales bacterium]
MNSPFQLSEAGFIALHPMVIIAQSKYKTNVDKISEFTNTSRHHVAKVLSKLSKVGFIKSFRGPGGGFYLNRKPSEINLLQILETVDGKYEINNYCQFNKRVCPFDKCIMDGKLTQFKRDFVNYLSEQKLINYLS